MSRDRSFELLSNGSLALILPRGVYSNNRAPGSPGDRRETACRVVTGQGAYGVCRSSGALSRFDGFCAPAHRAPGACRRNSLPRAAFEWRRRVCLLGSGSIGMKKLNTEISVHRPAIDTTMCTNCKSCIVCCPTKAIQEPLNYSCAKCIKYCMTLDVPCRPAGVIIRYELCDGCGLCILSCPNDAIHWCETNLDAECSALMQGTG